ncbi:unnamed protein product [Rhizoctonia solani]|uniref:Uncharacterized protein n=1 Tax=Rhizoctonia solani TaxID=456999 RepID=A0A8H3HMM6_9AGAM|nr:unnamed protein product [Rhizoctonia solani]
MATISNTRRALLDTGARRRRFLGPVLFAAATVARVVDVPGLRQPGIAALELVGVIKAPKRNRAKAREQIDIIDQEIASVRAEVSADTEADTGRHTLDIYLCEAQVYVDKLELLKKELSQIANKQYGGRFADQWMIVEALDVCEKQFVHAKWEFWEARWKFYRSSAQTRRHSRASVMTSVTRARVLRFLATRLANLTEQAYVRFGLMDVRSQHRLAIVFMITGAFF